MLFNSVEFAVFLAAMLGAYYAPAFRRHQVRVLVAGSFLFYAWEAPGLLLLLLASIAVNGLLSHVAMRVEMGRLGRWIGAGIVFNLVLIVFFKYGPLLASWIPDRRPDSVWHVLVSLPLPIGISFYTFESISLLVDIVRGRRSGAGRWLPGSLPAHLEKTALFVAFFPHLISGPILKADDFFPQIGPKRWADIEWDRVFRCCVAGYFFKMVVADNLKDATFNLSYPIFMQYHPVTLLALLAGYSFQIFADFAGYSWIAIGLGLLFGYRLPENFRYPYLAQSLGEFWRRWHVSLSSWLREYLYFPLGGSRHGEARTGINVFVVMALGGLWHGAAWSFAVWGVFHGLGLVVERWGGFRGEGGDAWARWFRRGWVFAFVSLGWLLFKLTDIHDVARFLAAVGGNWGLGLAGQRRLLVTLGLFSLPAVVLHWVAGSDRRMAAVRRHEAWLLGVALALIAVQSGLPGRFIYFQF